MPSAEKLHEEYGPDAVFTRVGDILIVHQDKPTESMIRERIAEVQREAKEPVDDCPLCEETGPSDGEAPFLGRSFTVVYQGNLLPKES